MRFAISLMLGAASFAASAEVTVKDAWARGTVPGQTVTAAYMTELFGGFPPEFLAAYCAAWAPDDGYRVRRDFYNLYHVLNHANLFAGGYVRQAEQVTEKLLAEIA